MYELNCNFAHILRTPPNFSAYVFSRYYSISGHRTYPPPPIKHRKTGVKCSHWGKTANTLCFHRDLSYTAYPDLTDTLPKFGSIMLRFIWYISLNFVPIWTLWVLDQLIKQLSFSNKYVFMLCFTWRNFAVLPVLFVTSHFIPSICQIIVPPWLTHFTLFMPPTLKKWGAYCFRLIRVCVCVCAFVRPFKKIQAGVLKFHIWIPRQK